MIIILINITNSKISSLIRLKFFKINLLIINFNVLDLITPKLQMQLFNKIILQLANINLLHFHGILLGRLHIFISSPLVNWSKLNLFRKYWLINIC